MRAAFLGEDKFQNLPAKLINTNLSVSTSEMRPRSAHIRIVITSGCLSERVAVRPAGDILSMPDYP